MSPDSKVPASSSEDDHFRHRAEEEIIVTQPDYDRLHRSEYRPPSLTRDITLSQFDYERFRAFALEKTGLDYPEEKRSMLSRGLAEVMAAAQCASLDQLYDLLRSSPSTSRAWELLVSALTVGETYFFRYASHFDTLAKHILPEILVQREHSSRRIRIWSAGCATGEEPYSIAILLREMLPNLETWNVLILATDINREALRKAQEGLYAPWSFRGVDKCIQDIYFRRNGDRQFAIDDRIKRMVTFDCLNLVDDHYPSLANNTNAMDVIMCRNVSIYFTAQTTQKMISNFYNCLVEGGWLIPGPSEPNLLFYREFESRNFPGTVIYQKPAAPKASLAPSFLFTPTPAAVGPLATSEAPRSPEPGSVVPSAAPALLHPPQVTIKKVVIPTPEQTPPPLDLYELALGLLREGQTDEAMAKLYEKLDRAPDFVPAYYTLGKLFANKGNLGEAQHWCERAIERDRLHPEPYFTLSMVYQQHGLLDMALDVLKKAVYLDRNFVLAHYHLAQIYQRQGEVVAARKSLRNIQRLLAGKPRDELIPEGDGLIVGRLLELVESQLAQEV